MSEKKKLPDYYVENRSNVEFDEISPNIINALIATEDARFYEHRGIDEIALLRVFVKSILSSLFTQILSSFFVVDTNC